MNLRTQLLTAAIGATALFSATQAQAAFNYSVSYADGVNVAATYPGTTSITTSSALNFFTLSPGGSATGNALPTNLGLFSLAPVSTAVSGSGASTVNPVTFTTLFSLQTVTDLTGTVNIGTPAVITITGTISGTFGPDSDNTTITITSGLPALVTAGGVQYSVSLQSIRSPGVVSSGGNTGGVTLAVSAVPEPASLSALGLGAVGLIARRRRQTIA
jgi:hypothetical protein